MKEDPEQSLPEAAPEAQPVSVPAVPKPSSARSSGSVSEVVVAYDDLLEIALLVSDATGFLDICEVHLSFQRQSEVSNIEGMPTLRRFGPAIVTNLPPEDQQQRFSRRPTLFQIPGESGSYVCARSTSLRLADQCVAPSPVIRNLRVLQKSKPSPASSKQETSVQRPQLGFAEEC